MPSARQHSPAAERNAQPILDVLARLLAPEAGVLEIASGTGQHAAFLGAAMPGWQWQPSDADVDALASIDAWCADVPNVRPAIALDVMAAPWPAQGPFDAVFCANMLHISPWASCAALMRGAAQVLKPAGLLLTYGPYLRDDVPTAPGNLAFDASLRARDPAWGIRRVEDVALQAEAVGLRLRETTAMPANNLVLAFARPG
jgi:SAM-dependent methyltransferase